MRLPRWRGAVLVATVLALLVPAWPGAGVAAASPTASSPVTTVQMIHFTFAPATVTITAGSTVTWTYAENATDLTPGCESPEFRVVPGLTCPGHSTTSADLGPDGKPLWDSGVHRAAGFPYSHTFTKPGTYHYYCTIHGGPHANNPLTAMNGTIVVTAAAAAPAAVASVSHPASPASTPILPETGRGSTWPAFGAVVLLGALGALRLRRRALHG